MIEKIRSVLKKEGKGMIIRGLVIALAVDIIFSVLNIDNDFLMFWVMLIIIVVTIPGNGIIKRK